HLDALDLRSLLYRRSLASEHLWSSLARRRMRADYLRVTARQPEFDLNAEYRDLLDAYDRSGLPYERALTRLGYGRWLLAQGRLGEARAINDITLDVAKRHGMRIVAADALELARDIAQGEAVDTAGLTAKVHDMRQEADYKGPGRP